MKVGIFSGTFDPVHKGHMAFAEAALAEAKLDKLVFLPEPSPRNKKEVASLQQRIKMLKLTIGHRGNLELFVSQAKVHSVEQTMEELYTKYGEKNDFFLLMGAEVFEYLESWPNHLKLVAENSFILALRSEDDGEIAVEVAKKLQIKPLMIASSFPSISSSKIREFIKQGKDVDELDDSVMKYAKEAKIYE